MQEDDHKLKGSPVYITISRENQSCAVRVFYRKKGGTRKKRETKDRRKKRERKNVKPGKVAPLAGAQPGDLTQILVTHGEEENCLS